MAFLKSLWQRVNPNRPRQSVELNPVEQLELRYLLQFGPRSADDIRAEVGGVRTIIDTELEDGLAHLVDAGLVETQAGTSTDLYTATRKSAILRNRIPLEPRGVTEFYL